MNLEETAAAAASSADNNKSNGIYFKKIQEGKTVFRIQYVYLYTYIFYGNFTLESTLSVVELYSIFFPPSPSTLNIHPKKNRNNKEKKFNAKEKTYLFTHMEKT